MKKRKNQLIKNQKRNACFTLKIHPKENETHQAVDGFGGSIAFWGTTRRAGDATCLQGIKDFILRAQGEVAPKGIVDHNKEVLERAMKINPDLEIHYSEPRSLELQNESDWLQIVEGPGRSYESAVMKMPGRMKLFVEPNNIWIKNNVTTLGVQNETTTPKLAPNLVWDPVD